jgi:hypothetical protein
MTKTFGSIADREVFSNTCCDVESEHGVLPSPRALKTILNWYGSVDVVVRKKAFGIDNASGCEALERPAKGGNAPSAGSAAPQSVLSRLVTLSARKLLQCFNIWE